VNKHKLDNDIKFKI